MKSKYVDERRVLLVLDLREAWLLVLAVFTVERFDVILPHFLLRKGSAR